MNICIDDLKGTSPQDSFTQEIAQLCHDYKPENKKESPIEMQILLEKEVPIYSSPSRLPQSDQQIVTDKVEEWIKEGIIRKSTSQYCSRVVLVPKKDGSKRVCIDYRRLNKLVFKDRFPVPNMEYIIDKLDGAFVFSVLDIESAFLHVPIEEKSRHFTAFVTKEGMFEFNFAPFGFCNSPANFIRYINCIFRQLINGSVMEIYMDDIIVYSVDEATNLSKLKKVFDIAASYGLKLNWKKCKFLQRRVEFLGLIVENGTIQPSDIKIKAVKEFSEPKNVKDIQSFLGLAGFFRKFVNGYSIIARPLTNLLKKDAEFRIGPEEKNAMKQLKTVLTDHPILRIFSRAAKTELHTDASKHGFGAILLQMWEGNLHPVYFWSKKTSEAESKQHSFFLETKAAFLAMKKLRHYLMGLEFVLVTDCNAFKQTIAKEDLPVAISRYVMYMQDFSFTVRHRSGVQMRHVDALSRYAVMTIETDSELRRRLENAQQGDEHIKAIMEILRTKQYQDYSMMGGVVFKEIDGQKLLVVPRLMEREIIRDIHEKSHFGATKTAHQVRQSYFIPHLDNKVNKIIQNCIKCILCNKKQGKQEGFLHTVDKGDAPLYTLHVDHLGPMDSTAKTYKYIFAMVDGFSKFVWLYPTKSTGSEEVLTKIQAWRNVFGNPARIISDKSAAFTSKQFAEFCEKQQIEHIQTTTGVPRGNGQIERVNRTILNILSKLSWDTPQQWYRYVDQVQRAINNAVHRSTKHSPFEILFGVKMRNNPVEASVAHALEDQLVEDFEAERELLREDAKRQIQAVQAEYKKTYDKRRKADHGYRVGDLIAIKRTQFVSGRKLASEFLGPYEVTKVKRNGRYDVKKAADCEGPKLTSTSSDFMKLWRYAAVDEGMSSGSDEESDGRL